ncbi:hypothetical protein AX769_19750 [Frondihabitans sp. PAMC 28766]|uniref:hypothetical protein n=1 Tax=Frondihabitans sp. PAMC 28766 TaxID=1795630 RepID=UPI00078B2485|nr:hypothetical protein [Frondihabitans sp. PAMC 28766]AMM21969.1 hypothetical protein AX769_19750 [Frondihabitans sp. PAMC 28766]
MSDPVEAPRRRLDAIRLRSASAVLLALVSLGLTLAGVKLSLLPIVVGIGQITHGAEVRERSEPPLAFLLMVPIGIAIAAILLHRG